MARLKEYDLMVYSIEQLKSAISKGGGIAKSNIFKVTLPPLGEGTRDYDLLCKAANIPGRVAATTERTIGPVITDVGNGFTNTDVTLTFMVLKHYFDRWQSLVFSQGNSHGKKYELGYKKDYAKTIKIAALRPGLPIIDAAYTRGSVDLNSSTKFDEVVYSVELYQAFPKSVTGFELNNELDGIIELQVDISFDTFKTQREKQTEINIEFNSELAF
jgi:hypothetical protein